MRVYRIISAREITNMYKRLNERKAVVYGENTHKYEKGTSYIHFFRYSNSAEYFFKRYRASMNYLDEYIAYMVANIPNDILRKRIGYGFYNIEEKPFDCYNVPIPEYAIRQEELKSDYIVEINNFIEYELKNQNGEYEKYLELMKKLSEQYNYDFHKIADYLESHNLEELLGVKDDDRTESEIFDDKVKKLSEIFPIYD